MKPQLPTACQNCKSFGCTYGEFCPHYETITEWRARVESEAAND